MKIEAGRYYKLRNGDLAYIEAVFEPKRHFPIPDFPVVGRSIYYDRLSWNLQGRYAAKHETELDIVAPFIGVVDLEAERLAKQKRLGVRLCGRASNL